MNQIIVNTAHKEEARIGVIKNKKLINLNIETSLNQKTKGNIYYAKISRIEPSLEAAFIDYGKGKHGFLSFKEVSESLKKDSKPKSNKLTINDVLSEGQSIIVQIDKEERGNKGAALTTNINLAGAYIIYTPNSEKSTGISRQIDNDGRQKLREIVKNLKTVANTGIIVRTAAHGKTLEELQWEVDYLVSIWNAIVNSCESNAAPVLIYKESNIIVRTIRDYLRDNTDSIVFDNKDSFKQAHDFVEMVLPHYLDKVKFFDNKEHSLFAHFGIEKQVSNIFKREVALSSGATIVFDPTEALTAIDINSARANKGANIEDTAYNSNLNAAKEIAAQLQLRDIGGLIVIDFIDMQSEEHKQSIVNAMKKHTANDKARIQIGDISKFGLLELSRQRIMSSVVESIEKTCTTCNGRGTIPTVPSLALSILQQITKACGNKKDLSTIIIQASVDVITYLINEKRNDISKIDSQYEIKILLLPNTHMQFPNWNISYKSNNKSSKNKSYQKITKPQNNIADNGLYQVPEEAIVNSFMPKTPKPIVKTGFLQKLKNKFFKSKKIKKQYKGKYKYGNNNNKRKNNQNNKR